MSKNSKLDAFIKKAEDNKIEGRVDFEKYQNRYASNSRNKLLKVTWIILLTAVFIVGLALMSQVAYNIYQLIGVAYNLKYVGIGISAIILLAYLVVMIIVIVKLSSVQSFDNYYYETNKRKINKSKVKNKKLRRKIAKNIVSYYEKSNVMFSANPEVHEIELKALNAFNKDFKENEKVLDLSLRGFKNSYLYVLKPDTVIDWNSNQYQNYKVLKYLQEELKDYDYKLIKKSYNSVINCASYYYLGTSVELNDDVNINNAIRYSICKGGPIYKKASQMIVKTSLECGLMTAISQDQKADAALVALISTKLIANLVNLYGFRPNSYQMNKLILKVIINVAASIGINQIPFGSLITSKLLESGKNNVVVGLFKNIIDSSIQLLTNGTLMLLLGRSAVKYLLEDFGMQTSLVIEEQEFNDKFIPFNVMTNINGIIKSTIDDCWRKIKAKGKSYDEEDNKLDLDEKAEYIVEGNKVEEKIESENELKIKIEELKKEKESYESKIESLDKEIKDSEKILKEYQDDVSNRLKIIAKKLKKSEPLTEEEKKLIEDNNEGPKEKKKLFQKSFEKKD